MKRSRAEQDAGKLPLLDWNIDYRFEGSIVIKARTPEEAQEKFDAMLANGVPRSIRENGEWSNDKPERA